jgi:hypothetical protein
MENVSIGAGRDPNPTDGGKVPTTKPNPTSGGDGSLIKSNKNKVVEPKANLKKGVEGYASSNKLN